MNAWIAAGIAVLAMLVSIYFAMDTQVTWWAISGKRQSARKLDRFLRRVNPWRAEASRDTP